MAWSSPITWVANVTALTAARLNVEVRDNLNYLKGMIDGTGSGDVTVPAALILNNDSVNKLTKNGSNPIWYVDTLDSLQYDRATNAWWFAVGGTVITTMASTGKLTGSAFYDSGVVSIATTATTYFGHGLGARPRFVWGYSAFNSADLDYTSTADVVALGGPPRATSAGAAEPVYLEFVDNTQIACINMNSSTKYCRVHAIL